MAKRTVTKRELCERIAKNTGLTQVAVKASVQGFIDAIIGELARGNRLEFRDFGVFDTRIQTARKARNPRTGDEVFVPAKAIAFFKVGKKMEEVIQNSVTLTDAETVAPRQTTDAPVIKKLESPGLGSFSTVEESAEPQTSEEPAPDKGGDPQSW